MKKYFPAFLFGLILCIRANAEDVVNNEKSTIDYEKLNLKFVVKFDQEAFNKTLLPLTLGKLKTQDFGIIEKSKEKGTIKTALKNKILGGMTDNILKGGGLSGMSFDFSSYLYFFSMINFDDGNWSARVNDFMLVPTSSKNIIKDIYIVDIEKDSITFVVTTYSPKNIELLKAMIERKVSYYQNYDIIKYDDKDYISFRLFAGQKINVNNFLISDI